MAYRYPYPPAGWTRPLDRISPLPEPRLNLGCGTDYKEGWVNVDSDPSGTMRVDQRMNLLTFPWPFADGAFGFVYLSHVLEHVPHTIPDQTRDGFFPVMEELHRVLRPDGLALVLTPHWTHPDFWLDPTHNRPIHPQNLLLFQNTEGRSFYSKPLFDVVEARPSAWDLWGRRPRIKGYTWSEHVWERMPFLRPVLRRRPREMMYLLRRLPGPALSTSAPAPAPKRRGPSGSGGG